MKPVLPEFDRTPNNILREWLQEQGISISEFGRTLGYLSQTAHLIAGKTPIRPVTFETIGRMLAAYGPKSPAEKLAKLIRQSELGQPATVN